MKRVVKLDKPKIVHSILAKYNPGSYRLRRYAHSSTHPILITMQYMSTLIFCIHGDKIHGSY